MYEVWITRGEFEGWLLWETKRQVIRYHVTSAADAIPTYRNQVRTNTYVSADSQTSSQERSMSWVKHGGSRYIYSLCFELPGM